MSIFFAVAMNMHYRQHNKAERFAELSAINSRKSNGHCKEQK